MQENLFNTIPMRNDKPISEMPDNRSWTLVKNNLIVVNIPPLRRIFMHNILVSEFKIGDAESERIAIIHAFLNGIGNQQQLASIWGVHYNTINNYVAAYKRLGIKGLTELFYQPEAHRSEIEEKETFNSEQIYLSGFVSIENRLEELPSAPIQEIYSIPEVILNDEINPIKEEETILEVIETEFGGNMLYNPLVSEIYSDILLEADAIEMKSKKTNNTSKIFDLRKIILTLIFYIFAGIANPEESKSLRRRSFGILIGERAAPCCKTLRKGLNMLTLDNFPTYINRQLTRQYVKLKYVELGTLYVDGHFVPYYGKMNVHKGYSTQRRLAMPGHYQNWANDRNGKPIFFYVNNSFVKFTNAIKNAVIDTLILMSESGINERLIVVFDRGGYDGKLFAELDEMKVGFITWQKGGKARDLTLLTQELRYINRAKEEVKYLSYKDTIKINNYREDVEAISVYDATTKKQSTFINNLEHVGIFDKTDSYKIQLLDGRWVQENFFKDAKVKIDLDEQLGYQFETDATQGEDTEYHVINPEWLTLSKEIEQLEKKLKRYAKKKQIINFIFKALKRKISYEKHMLKKGNKNTIEIYDSTKITLDEKREMLAQTEYQVKYNTLHEERKDILKTERSFALLGIRASVYNMRKRFDEMAAECFKDHRELSKFILSLTSTSATIKITNKGCYVKLKKLETPVYQRAAEKLIEKINSKNPKTFDKESRNITFHF